jgi:hypothetical protein
MSRHVYHIVVLELAKPSTYGGAVNTELLRDVRLHELLSCRFPHSRCDQTTKRMLVQTVVRSRPTQHPLQIASVHVPDVVLGPCGYPIIDEGWESAVGLVSEPAAELIITGIIVVIIIIIITIIIISISIIVIMAIITIDDRW